MTKHGRCPASRAKGSDLGMILELCMKPLTTAKSLRVSSGGYRASMSLPMPFVPRAWAPKCHARMIFCEGFF